MVVAWSELVPLSCNDIVFDNMHEFEEGCGKAVALAVSNLTCDMVGVTITCATKPSTV
jgi:hypothetical protein